MMKCFGDCLLSVVRFDFCILQWRLLMSKSPASFSYRFVSTFYPRHSKFCTTLPLNQLLSPTTPSHLSTLNSYSTACKEGNSSLLTRWTDVKFRLIDICHAMDVPHFRYRPRLFAQNDGHALDRSVTYRAWERTVNTFGEMKVYRQLTQSIIVLHRSCGVTASFVYPRQARGAFPHPGNTLGTRRDARHVDLLGMAMTGSCVSLPITGFLSMFGNQLTRVVWCVC